MAAENLQLNNSAESEQNKKFNQGIIVSFTVHAVLASMLILQVVFFSQPTINISQSIRVDMVALPDKLKPNQMPAKIEQILKEKPAEAIPAEPPHEAEKAPAKPLLPKKEIKTDNEAINLKKSKVKQKQALEKLKAQSAIEKMRQEAKEEDRPKKQANTAPVKGRVISAGTNLSGLDQLQNDNYLEILDAHIKQYWALPQWLKNKPLKARVLVKFDVKGKIISSQVVQSSGQSAYDDYCIQAIEQAAPFPKFAEKFSEKYSKDGVVFGFPE